MPSNGRKIVVAACGAAVGLFGLGGSAFAELATPSVSGPAGSGTTLGATTSTQSPFGAVVSQVARHHGRHHHGQPNGLQVAGLTFTVPGGVSSVTGTQAPTGSPAVTPEETNEAPQAKAHEQEPENRSAFTAGDRPATSRTSGTTTGTTSTTEDSNTGSSTAPEDDRTSAGSSTADTRDSGGHDGRSTDGRSTTATSRDSSGSAGSDAGR